MFLDPYHTHKTGWMEVICGCMFSGKSEELIRRLNPLIQHEYGHTLQSRIFGPAYFFPIMPWSGISAGLFTRSHDNRWFERGAQRNWMTYRRNKKL